MTKLRAVLRTVLLTGPMTAGACFAPSVERAPATKPERGFEFYSGVGGAAGDLWLGFTTFTHEPTGKTCVLLPVYHVADTRFYDEVQHEMDAADAVLTEGVAGPPSLSPGLALTSYAFANYWRLASFTGLTHQAEGLAWRENQRNADLRMSDFQSTWPWTAVLGQAVALPFVALVWEPVILTSWGERVLQSLVGRRDAFRAAWRHWLVRDANEDDDGDPSALLPGVIAARNERLLEVFDEVVADDAVQHVAIPWGAAHFPPLVPELERRGFSETGHRWVRAISVRDLRTGAPQTGGERTFDLFVPYVLQVRVLAPAWSVALLLQSILVEERPGGESRVELLWELLLSVRRNAAARELDFQVLPSLLGRPLLLDYLSRRDGSRLRFLWFFEV